MHEFQWTPNSPSHSRGFLYSHCSDWNPVVYLGLIWIPEGAGFILVSLWNQIGIPRIHSDSEELPQRILRTKHARMYNWWLYETKQTLTGNFGFSWNLMDPYGSIKGFYGISWIPVESFELEILLDILACCWISTEPHGPVRVLVQILRILLILTDYHETSKILWSHGFRSIPTDFERQENKWNWLENFPAVIWNAKLRRPSGWSEIHGYASCWFSRIVIYPTKWNSSGTCLEERRTWQSTISNMAKTSGQGVQRWLLTRNEPDENIA